MITMLKLGDMSSFCSIPIPTDQLDISKHPTKELCDIYFTGKLKLFNFLIFNLLSSPLILVFVFWMFFNEKLYRSLKY